MSKVFLSHSSIDKDFVRPVAELFGKDRCVFDECTFEAGMQNIDEIFEGLNNSDLFVYFISDKSLNSDWVKLELNKAQEKLYKKEHKIKQIFPIIIDNTVKYSDNRITPYLKEGFGSYNLRHIKNYKLAYKRILEQMLKLHMKDDPIFAEKSSLFYGRDIEIKKVKDRYDDYSKNSLKCLIVSGIEGIGRQSFIKKALVEVGIVKQYYSPSVISLSRNEAIDDFIIKISNLGFGDVTIEDVARISSIDSKIEIAADLLIDAQSNHEHIVVYDDMCLVNSDQTIKWWFVKILKLIKNETVIEIVTNYKVDGMQYKKNDDIFYIDLSELDKNERLGLLRRYSELEGIEFAREDIDFLQGSLTGYPPQITFCVDMAKLHDVEYVKNNSYKIVEFSSQKASEVLNVAIADDNKTNAYGLLSFISKYEVLPVKIIYEITKLNNEYADLLNKFKSLTICRSLGSSNEYIKVNNVIQDYILRNKYELPEDIKLYLKDCINTFNNNIENRAFTDYMDFSELSFYIKENLKEQKYVPEKFLYSTVFLKTIIELYDNKKTDRVIEIVKELKATDRFEIYDDAIRRQIQFTYCLSLARKKSAEFLTEVEFFNGESNTINYNFLKGFYFRQIGKLEFAISSYKNVLSKKADHFKVKRELVTVYQLLGDYDTALEMAAENYRRDNENLHHIQAYFECLINNKDITNEQIKDIQTMLSTLKKLHSEKATEIYFEINANYQAVVIKDKNTAVKIINEGIEYFPQSIYLAKNLFDIYERYHDSAGMEQALGLLSKNIKDYRSSYEPILISRQAVFDAYRGSTKSSIEIELYRQKNVPDSFKERVLKKVEFILNKNKGL